MVKNNKRDVKMAVAPVLTEECGCCGGGAPLREGKSIEKVNAQQEPSDVRVHVREQYGRAAAEFTPAREGSCCGGGSPSRTEQVSRMYEASDAADLPEDVTGLSMGCGDPVTLAALQPGQTVLDLGSGGGIDCFLAARRVGETGHVIGVDMTPQMLEKARGNKAKLGMENVEFRMGEIEHLPVADASVDVIISNCVINLSPDKPQVFREAFRVLKPGGLLAVSDIMTEGQMPDALREHIGAWAACVGGALEADDYIAAIEAAGFVDVEVTRIYPDESEIEAELEQLGISKEDKDRVAIIKTETGTETLRLDDVDMNFKTFSGKVRARKPLV